LGEVICAGPLLIIFYHFIPQARALSLSLSLTLSLLGHLCEVRRLGGCRLADITNLYNKDEKLFYMDIFTPSSVDFGLLFLL
jgi:hypothetical protein